MATAIEQNTLEAQPREAGTKNDAHRVRREGRIPAVVYGAGKDSLPISVDPRHVMRILNSETGHNTIFDLALSGGEHSKAMIVDWQYEPIKGKLLHIDLKRIALDKVLRVSVPIFLVGESAGVKQEGGIMEQMLRELEIECLPGDIPSHINADVSLGGGQDNWGDLIASKAHEPLSCCTPGNRTGFDDAFERPMLHHLEMPNLGEGELALLIDTKS